MSRTAKFAHELCNTLNGKKTGYAWSSGRPPCSNRECVDAIGENGNARVLVEVELRRGSPVTNVVKIWKWLGERTAYTDKRVILLQAFSAYYKKRPAFQRANAIYMGRQLEKRFRRQVAYIPIDFKFSPHKKRVDVTVAQGGGATRRAARRLASAVARKLRHLAANNEKAAGPR